MAAIRTGRASLLAAIYLLCRLYNKYGAGPLVSATGNADWATILPLVRNACEVFRAGDNFPGEIDPIAPDGPED